MQQRMKRWLHKYKANIHNIWPAILWSAFIFILLIIPLPKQNPGSLFQIPHLDKLIHLSLFLIQSILWLQYLKKSRHYTPVKTILFLIITSLFYGIMLEYIQLQTGRNFDPADMIANAAGAISGCFIKKSRIKL
jgi:VanZ family protein